MHAHVAEAVSALQSGRLVAFPTETVYGLGADAFDAAAVQRVFDLKGRPARNPLIVHVCDVAMARDVVRDWTPEADALAKALWPGPLSIVLPKAGRVPDLVTGGSPNVAVRCPDHALTLELIRAFGKPLVGPSANPSGSISPTTADHVRGVFGDREVYVLDGGACRGGIESTVLTLAEDPPRVLRPGLVSAEQISSILQRPVADFVARNSTGSNPASTTAPLESPGLLERHYAPRTRAVMARADEVEGLVRRAVGRMVVISHAPLKVGPPHECITLPADAPGYAASLYAALQRADTAGAGVIVVVKPPMGDPHKALWAAILDRVQRATAQ